MSDKETHRDRKSRENNFRKSFRDVFDGSVLTRDIVIRQLPFIIFLALLALIYITNRYHAEKVFVLTEETRKEIRELRSEKITVQSELMRKSRQQEVLKMLDNYGSDLNYAEEPPVKIIYDVAE